MPAETPNFNQLRSAAREGRGELIQVPLPSPEKFNAELALYHPGCGSPTHVAGTNGGEMRCGATLKQLDGSTARYFCAACEPNLMNTQHTPEPWYYRQGGECVMAPDDWVCIVHNNDHREANARRIVACVNACKGINPEAVPDLLEALQVLLLAYETAKEGARVRIGAELKARAAITKATKKD